jgi:NodT family efflux transporter outer membrane factor (OMF) lipoprotein
MRMKMTKFLRLTQFHQLLQLLRRPPGIGFVLALCLGACAQLPEMTPTSKVRETASLGIDSSQSAPVLAPQWWLAFGDDQLSTLIEQALQANPTLKLVHTRVARARAGVTLADSASQLQVNAQLDATRQQITKNGIYPPPLAGSVLDMGTLQLGASWELDFFGKNSAALAAALGGAQAAAADAQAARLMLAVQVTRAYFQILRLNEQLTLAKRTVAQRQAILTLVQARVEAGLDTRLELRQSEGGVPEARLQLEVLQEQLSLATHALAALTGQSQAMPAIRPVALSSIRTGALNPVIPADLLARRADVTAARWRVEAGVNDVANARTMFYPNVNLVAFAGYSSIGLDRLTENGSQQWGVGPAIRLPLFDGDRLRANLRGKAADLDAAIESYNATVLDAVRDVADQVASVQSVTRQQEEQAASSQAIEHAYQIAQQREQAGLISALQVLLAETPWLAQRRLNVDLRARTLENQLSLMRALGGGYVPETDPAAAKAVALQSSQP